MNKFTDYLLYLVIAYLFYAICNSAFNSPINKSDTTYDMQLARLYNYHNLDDPEQTPYLNLTSSNIIKIEKNNSTFKIYPQAGYRIYAMVMSKARYFWGWDGDLVPFDLALAWNMLMLPENQKNISYTQSNRWYYYNFGPEFPLPKHYVDIHSANHHIIPANKNVFKAISKVRNKEKIYMEGFLVNVSGNVNGNKVWRNTSLSRLDTGDGACEVFYVKRAVLDGKVYE